MSDPQIPQPDYEDPEKNSVDDPTRNGIESKVQDQLGTEQEPVNPDMKAASEKSKNQQDKDVSEIEKLWFEEQKKHLSDKLHAEAYRRKKEAKPDASRTMEYGKQDSPYHSLDSAYIQQKTDVFVDPTDFPTAIRSSEQRIFIVAGPEIPGTMTVSVKLASLIISTYSTAAQYERTSETLPIFRYEHASTDKLRTLNTIVKDSRLEGNSVYILPR